MKNAWVKVSQLVVPDVTDKEMVLIHLLWFQSIKRVVIYDADPLSGAVLIFLSFDQLKKRCHNGLWCILGASFLSPNIRKTPSEVFRRGFLILKLRRGRDPAALRLRYLGILPEGPAKHRMASRSLRDLCCFSAVRPYENKFSMAEQRKSTAATLRCHSFLRRGRDSNS